jgi:type II secretory ATPase GspE/PulE/Tfp pilus assembly ATPase PilB-like protein
MQAQRVVGLARRGSKMPVAISDPSNTQALDQIKFQAGTALQPDRKALLQEAIQRPYGMVLVPPPLHTNDAPSALTRLMNMGVAPFNIASSGY